MVRCSLEKERRRTIALSLNKKNEKALEKQHAFQGPFVITTEKESKYKC